MPDAQNTADAPIPDDASAWVVRLALRFGIGFGLLYAAWLLALHLMGENPFGPKRMLVQFAVPLAVVGSQWALRRALRPGKPGLVRALAVGAITAVLAATVGATSLYGLGQGVGEAAMQRNRTELLGIARANKAFMVKRMGGEAAYRAHEAQVMQLTAGDVAKDDFIKILLLGSLLVLPAGVFLRE